MPTPKRTALASLPEGLILQARTFLPATGATAVVYQHGTQTPVTIYADETGAGILPQPLTADANGELPGFVLAEQDVDIVATYGGVAALPAEATPIRAADIVGPDPASGALVVGGTGSLGLSQSVGNAISGLGIDLCSPAPVGGVTGSHVPGDDLTSDIQAAINWANTNNRDITIYCSKQGGAYNVNGAQQTGTAQGYNYSGQILFPARHDLYARHAHQQPSRWAVRHLAHPERGHPGAHDLGRGRQPRHRRRGRQWRLPALGGRVRPPHHGRNRPLSHAGWHGLL